MSSPTEAKTEEPPTVREILDKAGKSAMRGGTAGAVAMGLNVGALMWMRTTVSCRNISISNTHVHVIYIMNILLALEI